MKFIGLLIAALCAGQGLATPIIDPRHDEGKALIPRVPPKGYSSNPSNSGSGKGSKNPHDAFNEHTGSSRGGRREDYVTPKGYAPHSKDDVARAQKVARENEAQKASGDTSRRIRRVSTTPPRGTTAYKDEPESNEIDFFPGDSMVKVSQHEAKKQRTNPEERGHLYQPRSRAPSDKKAANDQRDTELKGLPSRKGIVRDHKPWSGVRPREGQGTSVIYDTEISQGKSIFALGPYHCALLRGRKRRLIFHFTLCLNIPSDILADKADFKLSNRKRK